MPIFFYRGRVLPENSPLTLDYKPTIARTDALDTPDATMALDVADGAVVITVTVDEFDADTGRVLFLPAQDLARSAVEIASFSHGIAYVVLLEEFENPAGEIQPLILADRELAKRCTAFSPDDLEAVTDLVVMDLRLARALSDVVVILSWGHYAPIACGRVADSIVRMLTNGRSPSDWAQMRQILRVDRAYIQLLTDHAAPPRHGDRVYVDGLTTRQLAERAWTLMNRYLAYRLGGSEPLDSATFPVLVG